MRQIIFYTQKKLFCFRILQIFEKILQIPGIGQRETAAAGPAQRGEVAPLSSASPISRASERM